MIGWVGSSDCFHKPDPPSLAPTCYMALTEEAVFETARLNELNDTRGIRMRQALACTSKLLQRCLLDHTGLNPHWHPIHVPPGYAKVGASAANCGVHKFQKHWYIENLYRHAPNLAHFGVWEKQLSEESFVVDGYVCGGQVYNWSPLRCHWENDRIVWYEKTKEPGLWDKSNVVVDALGLDWTPFCIEYRRDQAGDWKVVEAHCRLGEDYGYEELLGDGRPLQAITKACDSALNSTPTSRDATTTT